MALHQLVDQLEAMIRDAKDTPILGGARLDRERAYDLIDQILAEVGEAVPLDEDRFLRRGVGALVPLDELDEALHNAKTVPFTDSPRVDREQLLEIVTRLRQGARQDQVFTRDELQQRPIRSAKVRALLDRAEALVRSAKPIPLTTQVRIQKRAFAEVTDQLRECGAIALLPAADALDDAIHNAAPVPLTDEVRMERDELHTIIQQMRAAFSQGTPAAPTN